MFDILKEFVVECLAVAFVFVLAQGMNVVTHLPVGGLSCGQEARVITEK